MAERRLSHTELERRLKRCQADYEAAKARVLSVGFICEGSLVERFTSCPKLNCRCQDPEHRHGPYFQLSWKESGKTVSKLISADDAARYQEWIANRRRLESALEEMRDLSRKAGEYTLAKDDHQYLGPIRPRQSRRSAR
jgi:hypothetical protein